MADDELAARVAAIRDKTTHILSVASDSPDLMRANERAYAALEALLKLHQELPWYSGAEGCDHPEPAGENSDEYADWEGDHPWASGGQIRICLDDQVGSFCPECTRLAYGEEDPFGEDYASAPCGVRQAIARALLGEASSD